MEVIMSSPIQKCAEMENDRAAADLLKYQESERRKLIQKLKVARRHVGIIPQSLIQVNPNADLGATALVQLTKSQRKRSKKLLREYIENPEIKLEDACQLVDMITHPSIPDYSMITESSIQDFLNTEIGTTANVQPCEHKSTKELLTEHIENPESKLEVARQNVDVMTQPSIQDNANTNLGTAATVEPSKPQKRRKRKLLREDTENLESKPEVPSINADDIIQSESSRSEEQMEVGNHEMRYSSAIGAHDAKCTMSKGEKDMNIAISETVSSKTANIDTGSKREEHTEVANGEMGSNMPKNVHVDGAIEKKKKKKSSRKKQQVEMDSGTTATDNTVSKKRKRQKLEKKNPASGDILGTSVGIQDILGRKVDLLLHLLTR